MFGIRRWLLRVLVVLLFGGLVAMHGVTWVGGGGLDTTGMAPSGSSHSHEPAPDGGGHGALAGHVAALCVAVLAATGLQLLVRRSRRVAVGPTVGPRPVAHTPPTPRPLRPPEPGRLALNVARC